MVGVNIKVGATNSSKPNLKKRDGTAESAFDLEQHFILRLPPVKFVFFKHFWINGFLKRILRLNFVCICFFNWTEIIIDKLNSVNKYTLDRYCRFLYEKINRF